MRSIEFLYNNMKNRVTRCPRPWSSPKFFDPTGPKSMISRSPSFLCELTLDLTISKDIGHPDVQNINELIFFPKKSQTFRDIFGMNHTHSNYVCSFFSTNFLSLFEKNTKNFVTFFKIFLVLKSFENL